MNTSTNPLSLQQRINEAQKNDVILIDGGEFTENLIINKPLTLKGKSLVSIVGNSNILKIESNGVILENIYIESVSRVDSCLIIKNGTNPKFINVFIKGNLKGVKSEEGVWDIPHSALELQFISNRRVVNIIKIYTPVIAKVYIDSDILTINKSNLLEGINIIEIGIKEIEPNSFVCGEIIIETNIGLKRKISLYGHTSSASSSISNDVPILYGHSYQLFEIKFEANNSFIEDQEIKIPIEIISDNSKEVSITFQNLPDKVYFADDSALKGTISTHGFYIINFQVSDALQKNDYIINITVFPKIPLNIDISPNVEFPANEPFSIPFGNLNELDIEFKTKLINPTNEKITLGNNCLEGNVFTAKQFKVSLELTDKYGRRVIKDIGISITPERPVNLNWMEFSELIEFKNYEGQAFTANIQGEVKENRKCVIIHSIIEGILPKYFRYTQEGILNGIIDGNEYSLTIKAEVKNINITKKIRIKTTILNRIASIPIEKSLGSAFHGMLSDFYSKEKPNESAFPKVNPERQADTPIGSVVEQSESQPKNVFQRNKNQKEELEKNSDQKASDQVKLGNAFKRADK